MRVGRALSAAVCVAALATVCGGGHSKSRAARQITFEGRHGTLFGSGRDGVVLALPYARRLKLPALFVGSRYDPYAEDDTPLLERAAPSAEKRLLVVPGDAHGVDLTPRADVRKAVLRFVRARVRDPAPPQSLAARCGNPPGAPSQTFWFRARDGLRLDGATVGSGRTAIVLAHEYPSDLCPWLDYAGKLAREGFRAFLFDFRGFGRSEEPQTPVATWRLQDDLAGAVAEARRRGAERVFLVGASMGGSAVLTAAPTISPPVDGVVSLSGETDIDAMIGSHGLDPLPVAKRIHVPVLLAGSREDGAVSPAELREIARRVSGPAEVVVRPGGAHGWTLLDVDPKLVSRLDAFYRHPGA